MRQTSRAVALLLAVESAQAALTANIPAITGSQFYYQTVFYPPTSLADGATVTQQLNSRTAGYVIGAQQQQKFLPEPSSALLPTMELATNNYQKAICVGTTYAEAKADPGSSCMECIGAGAIWCSRTFAYLETAPTIVTTVTQSPYNYALTDVSTSLMSAQITANLASSDTDLQTGASKDQGSCCWDATNFNAFIGAQDKTAAVQPANSTGSTTDGVVFVEASCVALKATTTIATNAWGTQQIDAETTRYTSWWCSNGLYKKVTGVGAVVVNAQQIIGVGVNKRQELAMVGCPQKTLMCGTSAAGSIVTNFASSTASAVTLTVTTDLTTSDKCTWVAQAMLAAPTFKFGSASGTGITSSNWQIHAMEYTATVQAVAFDSAVGSLSTASTDATTGVGYQSASSALTSVSFIPKFNMPADQFATLRTWYGEAGVIGAIDPTANLPAAWLTPGQAPISNSANASLLLASVPYSEMLGNVVNVPYSKISTQTGTTDTVGDATYGSANAFKYDLRQARYFPAQVAQTVWNAGDEQNKKYIAANSSYATAKTAWDNYVAILEKNAKTDAFAALFSPPKSPTVPPLPSLPWVPAAYAGYVKATQEELSYYNLASSEQTYTTAGKTTNPTAQQFWTNLTAAQTVGGWGSFTAQVLRFRNGWGKSYGTIGYSGAATNDMSAVWNYLWTCAVENTTGPGTTPCDKVYSGSLASPGVNNGPANVSTNLISVVSLWSTANSKTISSSTTIETGYAFTGQSFTLTWTPTAWSGSLVALKAIDAPVAATAAKGLSGVAGAQALAATSAAALAVAAALY